MAANCAQCGSGLNEKRCVQVVLTNVSVVKEAVGIAIAHTATTATKK